MANIHARLIYAHIINIQIVKNLLNLISGVLSDFFIVNDTKRCLIPKNEIQAIKTAKNDIKTINHLTHARYARLRTQVSNFLPIYTHVCILYNIAIVKNLLNLISGVLSGFLFSIYTLICFFVFRTTEIKKGVENDTFDYWLCC